MDFHKKEWEEKPVVLDKPRRGREMVTTDVPKDLLDTMRMVTVKQQLKDGKAVKSALEAERQGDVEMYHEGWVDGKRYLVPDSNLEIMKDLVNLRIRRKGDSVFVNKKEYEASRLDTQQKFQRKLRKLSGKINELEKAKLVKKKSAYKTSSDIKSATESTVSSINRRKPFEIVPMNEESTTFLISGHIRKNASPLYVIQKYKGKSPFGKRRSDFSEVKSTRDVDILISGNFYKSSVLEEGLHSIEGIRLKWNVLVPIDERSKLYERSFAERFDVKGVEILFQGDFIKQKGKLNYTPILTFMVPRPASLKDPEGRRNKARNLYKSISSLFGSSRNVDTYHVQVESKPSMKSTTDDFTSSVEDLDGKWTSTEGLDGDDPTDKEQRKEEDESGYDKDGEFKNEKEPCKINLVLVTSSKNGKRSVAGGSSGTRLPEDVLLDGTDPDMAAQEWSNCEFDDDEETVVVFAAKDDLWNPMCNAEPDLRTCSSHSVCGRARSDNGDAFYGRRAPVQDKGEELPCLETHKSGETPPTPGAPGPSIVLTLGDEVGPRSDTGHQLARNCTSVDYKIPEYKCQVRPSKKSSHGNCLLQNISKLFSK